MSEQEKKAKTDTERFYEAVRIARDTVIAAIDNMIYLGAAPEEHDRFVKHVRDIEDRTPINRLKLEWSRIGSDTIYWEVIIEDNEDRRLITTKQVTGKIVIPMPPADPVEEEE